MYRQCHKNMSYVLAIWKFIGSLISLRAKYLRCNIFELTRILNHIMRLLHMRLTLCINTILMGLWRKRNNNEFYERVSGARLHAASFSTWRLNADVPEGFLTGRLLNLQKCFIDRLSDMEELLTNNRIWRARLRNCWRCWLFLEY